MKNLRKLSAIVLSTVFATMQVSFAAIDTGLGNGIGGAVINNATGGFVNVDKGVGTADLNFNGNAHVNWNTLNVGSGETLNFNAISGASNLTILNTVNSGMSNFYGNVNANNGIGNLIISNPNGMIYDGAHFTTAGDLMLTTKDMSNFNVNNFTDAEFTKLWNEGNLIPIQIKNGARFEVNGDYTILAPQIHAANSSIQANTLKLITANGQDYLNVGENTPTANRSVTTLKAMSIDGDVVIANAVGATQITDGGTINGDLKAVSGGYAWYNRENSGNKLVINGDVDLLADSEHLFLRNADVDGNLKMTNRGGFVDMGDVNVTGNADLTTTGMPDPGKYHHFVHVIGDSSVGGDLNIESSQNIHIGGYDYDAEQLAAGKLNVGGELNAHATNGHITTTIDTTAKKINMKSDNYNILSDGRSTLKADEYQFVSNGFIGGIADGTDNQGNPVTRDKRIVSIMENYIYIPADIANHNYLQTAGGKITKVATPVTSPAGNTVQTYISSTGDLEVTGANVGDLNLTAYRKRIDITGNDVHAKNVNVGPETDYLKLEFPNRDFTTNYTNIRDGVVTTIRPDEEITYALTNGTNGYNQTTLEPTATKTYLIGPDNVIPPEPTPVPNQNIPDNENAKNLMTQWAPDDIMQSPVNTPVAFAADLDDDEVEAPVRKNVDGSVTVVRAFPMM